MGRQTLGSTLPGEGGRQRNADSFNITWSVLCLCVHGETGQVGCTSFWESIVMRWGGEIQKERQRQSKKGRGGRTGEVEGKLGQRVPSPGSQQRGFHYYSSDEWKEKWFMRLAVYSHKTFASRTPVTWRAVWFWHECSPQLLCFLKKRGLTTLHCKWSQFRQVINGAFGWYPHTHTSFPTPDFGEEEETRPEYPSLSMCAFSTP